MAFWDNLLVRRAEKWLFTPLKGSQVPEAPLSQEEVLADAGYITIEIRCMRIMNVRRLTQKFYGVVHSYVSMLHRDTGDAVFQYVSVPSQLKGIDPSNLDRVVTGTKRILGPVPYRGETVSLDLGLFSVQEADLAEPFLGILEMLASQAGVAVVSAAKPFIEPIRQGLNGLVGNTDDSILEIGLSRDFYPVTGWYTVIRATSEQIEADDLRVRAGDYVLLNSGSGAEIRDYPYLVFTLQHSKERADWFKLPALTETYKKLKQSVQGGKYTDAKEDLIAFRRSALTSGDLILPDARRIVELVEAETNEVMEATTTARAPTERTLPELERYPLYQ